MMLYWPDSAPKFSMGNLKWPQIKLEKKPPW